MLLNIFLHALVLGIIVLIVTKGQNRPDISILLGLPIGLSVLSGFLFLFLGYFSIIISFGISVFALRWAFDLTTRQSLTVTSIWSVWQIVYTIIKDAI
jgi:hypothetical protein